MSESPIVQFYRGAGVDHRGRRLDDILRWNDDALEAVHDYVQWLFPLDAPSMFNRDAPLLGTADCAAFRRDSTLSGNLRRAFDRMLAFYGLQAEQTVAGLRIERSSSWPRRSAVWLTPGNHNHLRLTRIMKSLMLLGQPQLARALLERLQQEAESAVPQRISATTLAYWLDAMNQHPGV